MNEKIKNFVFLTLALIATAFTFSSCSETDDSVLAQADITNGTPIRINASEIGNWQTRASSINYDGMGNFGLYAFIHNTGSDAYVNYFMGSDGNPVIYKPSGTGKSKNYSTDKTYYWTDDTLDFVAVYPSNLTYSIGTYYTKRPNAPVFDSGIPHSFINVNYTVSDKCDEQHDIMLAESDTLCKTKKDGVVYLNFNHLLSRINFLIAQPENGFNVEITSITMPNVYALYDGSAYVSSSDNVKQYLNWNDYKSRIKDMTITDSFNSTADLNEKEGDITNIFHFGTHREKTRLVNSGYLMIPPQKYVNSRGYPSSLENSEIKTNELSNNIGLKLRCRIKDSYGTYIGVKPGTAADDAWIDVYVPLPSMTFEAGKAYTFTLQYNGSGVDENGNSITNPIKVNVAVNEWNKVTSSSSDNLHF